MTKEAVPFIILASSFSSLAAAQGIEAYDAHEEVIRARTTENILAEQNNPQSKEWDIYANSKEHEQDVHLATAATWTVMSAGMLACVVIFGGRKEGEQSQQKAPTPPSAAAGPNPPYMSDKPLGPQLPK